MVADVRIIYLDTSYIPQQGDCTRWLEGHQLHATATYFANHSLDGVDMLYLAPADLENDGIPLAECARFGRLVAEGDAANWLNRHGYHTIAQVAVEHSLAFADIGHATRSDMLTYGVTEAEADRFLRYFGDSEI